MKKLTFIFSFIILGGLVLYPLLAQETTTTTTSTTSTTSSTTTTLPITTTTSVTPLTTSPLRPIIPIVKGINPNNLRQYLSIEEVKGWRLGVLSQLPGTTLPVATKTSTVVYIKAGTVQEVGTDYFKVKVFDYVFKVKIEPNTQTRVLKSNWSNIELNDISVGDVVNVYGYLDNTDSSLIYALTVRDLSYIASHVSLRGTITSIDSTGKTFTLRTLNNTEVKVAVSSDTKIVKYDENGKVYTEGSFNDLVVNQAVIVRGLYNRTQNVFSASLVIIGRDERPFFKSFVPTPVTQQERERLQNQAQEIRNQIQNQIQQLREQLNQWLKALREKRGQ